jgi:hypothetical protein
MRRQPENENWPEDTPDRNSDLNRRKKGSSGKDTSPESSEAGSQASQDATLRKKLEDLNDREDLSERQLNDRNWQ